MSRISTHPELELMFSRAAIFYTSMSHPSQSKTQSYETETKETKVTM